MPTHDTISFRTNEFPNPPPNKTLSLQQAQLGSDFQYLDLILVESLPVVYTNDAADHLRDDDHVAQVSPHRLRLLASWCLTLLQYSGSEVQNEDLRYKKKKKNRQLTPSWCPTIVSFLIPSHHRVKTIFGAHDHTALRSFLTKAMGLRFNPRWNLPK